MMPNNSQIFPWRFYLQRSAASVDKLKERAETRGMYRKDTDGAPVSASFQCKRPLVPRTKNYLPLKMAYERWNCWKYISNHDQFMYTFNMRADEASVWRFIKAQYGIGKRGHSQMRWWWLLSCTICQPKKSFVLLKNVLYWYILRNYSFN